MSYRIFITGSGIAEEALHCLKMENCVVEMGDPGDAPEDIAQKFRVFNPDGIIVRQGKITEAVQDAAKNLKVICKHGVGTDNIDLDAATRRGIPVMFTPKANYEAAAEHALALMLALVRRIPTQDRRIRDGIFDKKRYRGQELLGKTLGLIGFGKIARRLAELVAPFRMNVLVYHPSASAESLPGYITKVQKKEDVFAQADIISLHCPLTPETKEMIHQQSIAQMKEGVYLINTARGGIVKESDLYRALQDGTIGGAALDVFESEPPVLDNPLFKMKNVILTPHVGGVSDNSLKNMGMDAVKNVLTVLKGDFVDRASLVNKNVLEKK